MVQKLLLLVLIAILVQACDSSSKPEEFQTLTSAPIEIIVFPDLGIEKELPLGRQVEVSITPKRNVSIAFTCGMGMYQGSIVAVQ